MSDTVRTHTEKLKFYLHRDSDGTLTLKTHDMSDYRWSGQCVLTVELDLTVEVPSEQDMLLAAKATFEARVENERAEVAQKIAEVEQKIADIREAQQQYFAITDQRVTDEVVGGNFEPEPMFPASSQEDDIPF